MRDDERDNYARDDYYLANPDDRCETCGGEHNLADCPFLDDEPEEQDVLGGVVALAVFALWIAFVIGPVMERGI